MPDEVLAGCFCSSRNLLLSLNVNLITVVWVPLFLIFKDNYSFILLCLGNCISISDTHRGPEWEQEQHTSFFLGRVLSLRKVAVIQWNVGLQMHSWVLVKAVVVFNRGPWGHLVKQLRQLFLNISLHGLITIQLAGNYYFFFPLSQRTLEAFKNSPAPGWDKLLNWRAEAACCT